MPLSSNDCLKWGHKPAHAKYFGPDHLFFVRHCKRCFYSEAGHITLDNGIIKINVQVKANPA